MHNKGWRIRVSSDSECDNTACTNHPLHQCVQLTAKDFIHQDDRDIPNLQPVHPILRSHAYYCLGCHEVNFQIYIACSFLLWYLIYLIKIIYFPLLHRHTNQGDGTKIFVPAANTVNKKTKKRYIKTFIKIMSSNEAIVLTKLIGMAGLPLIFMLFNITFFIIGMSGWSEMGTLLHNGGCTN